MTTSVKIEITADGKTEALLDKLPVVMRHKALKLALKAAGQVVAKRARQLVPKSSKTGTTKNLSASEKSKRGFPAKPLARTIRVLVRDYGETQVAAIGPEYPAGAHGHLVEFGHEKVLWGNEVSGKTKPHPFMRPAADETKAEQQKIIATTITQEIDKVANGG